jgi:UDP-glucuronate decarboxylase
MKTILVTGGAGFLGSHLCSRLLDMGNEVIALDNLSTSSKENIKPLLSNDRFEFIRQDVTIPVDFYVDEIYSMACPASPIHYQKTPVQTIETSLIGTSNCLKLARKCGASILLTSTSEIYGDPIEHPQKESYLGNVNCNGIRACYDESKRASETLMVDYCRQYNVDIRIARLFNTYGPNMHPDDGRVVSNFICQAIRGEDITIYGSGQQTRSFCYVDDMISALILLMESGYRQPMNLGNPGEFTMLELAEKVIKMTKSESNIVFRTLPEDDPKQRKPVIDLAKEVLKWKPRTNLEYGLLKTIEYFKGKVL